jgi:multidrug transporter EmrE-like cation transporter
MNGTARGFGWIAFAGYVLIIGGAFNVMDGIVALARSSFFVAGAHYVFSDLRTWGWIILALGIVEALAGFSIFTGSQWARWFGIGIASVNAIGQLMFAQAYPLWSLIIIGVDLLVIYGLAVYGGPAAAAARVEAIESETERGRRAA